MFDFERTRPEKVGISPAVLLKYLKSLERVGFVAHSIIIARHNKIAFEIHFNPFKADIMHYMCSCSKSVAATAVGFALAEGLFKIDDKIVDLLPEKLNGAPHEYTAAMTVKHLLTMSTAFSDFEPKTDDLAYDFMNNTPDHYPGTVFGYDSLGTYTLCEITQKFAGMDVERYLRPRLLDPLGIKEVLFPKSKQGVCAGNGGFCMRPEDMVKFGLLYLNKGVINGVQILPPGWAEEATAGHVSCVTTDGSFRSQYGYKFWRVQNGGFACLGLAGQAIVMHQDKDLVFVGTANGFQTDNHYFHMEYFWQHVFDTLADGPIPFEDCAYDELNEYVKNAEAFLPCGINSIPAAFNDSGKFYGVRENQLKCGGFRLNHTENNGELELTIEERIVKIPFGYGKHAVGSADLHFNYAKAGKTDCPNGYGSAGRWVDGRTLVIQSHAVDTLNYFIITLHFGESAAVLQITPFGIYKFDGIPVTLTHVYGA